MNKLLALVNELMENYKSVNLLKLEYPDYENEKSKVFFWKAIGLGINNYFFKTKILDLIKNNEDVKNFFITNGDFLKELLKGGCLWIEK